MYDVGIIGAGPAGATLARLLAGRCRVLLLNSGRKKCCGGILTLKSHKMLAKLDLTLPSTVLVDPQPSTVAVWDLDNQLIRHYARQYANIDRAAFDHWLLSLVPKSIDVRNDAIYRWSQPKQDGFEIFFTEKGENQSEDVRYLVGADGAFSMVRREFFQSRHVPKRYIAPQEWFQPEDVFLPEETQKIGIDFYNDYVGIFDSAITDFYAWLIPKNGQLVLGAAIPYGEKPREKFDLLKKKLESFGLRFGLPFYREADQLLRPLNSSSICLGSDRVILLGEAAGLISPSSAEGVSPALTSAFYLAQSFYSDNFDVSTYHKNLRWLRWNLLLKKTKIPVMFVPRFRKWIIQSGLTALD